MLCCLATSLSASCFPDPDTSTVPVYSSRLSLLNRTHELMEVDVTPLVFTYEDCPQAQAHPARLLASAFERSATTTLVLGSGQEMAIPPNERYDIYGYSDYGYGGYDYGGYDDYYYNTGCEAYLLEVSGVGAAVAYLPEALNYKQFMLDVDVPEALPSDVQTIELTADYERVLPTARRHQWGQRACASFRQEQCTQEERAAAAQRPPGASYGWGQSEGQRLIQTEASLPREDALCALDARTWSVAMDVPYAEGVLFDVESDAQGRCHGLRLTPNQQASPFATICFEDASLRDALRLDVGRPRAFALSDTNQGFFTRRVVLDLYDRDDPERVEFTYEFVQGYDPLPGTDSTPNPTCRARQTTCGWASVGLDTFVAQTDIPLGRDVWTDLPDGWSVRMQDAYQHTVLRAQCENIFDLPTSERQHLTYVRRRVQD